MTTRVRALIAIYVIGFCVSWPIAWGIFFHSKQAITLNVYRDHNPIEQAAIYRAEDLGEAAFWSTAYSVFWPLGLPAAYVINGFAEHGIFTQSDK